MPSPGKWIALRADTHDLPTLWCRARADAPPGAALTPALETLRRLLGQSPAPLTRQEILARWPESEPAPRADSLWRCLARGCELGRLFRTGAGAKAAAFRPGLA